MRFYASIQGCRGEATRMGGKESGIHGHIRGWNVGARIFMSVNEDDEDVCTIRLTSGSSGGKGDKLIGKFKASDLDG